MRTTLLIFILPLLGFAQLTVSDDFSDGDFLQNPSWTGDTSVFIVNSGFELQLDDSVAGEAFLGTNSEISLNARWRFNVRMAFNPSSSNYCKVYLISDAPNLSSSLRGYYVRLGGSSADRISLYRQDGNTNTLLAESTDDWLDVNQVDIGVNVSRDSTGLWVLSADTAGGQNYAPLDSAVDSTYRSSLFFGVYCKYTTTRSDRFYFDNFDLSGSKFTDTQPASIADVEVLDSAGLQVYFTENMDSLTAVDIGNYLVNQNAGLPVSALQNPIDKATVTLRFGRAFQSNIPHLLYVNGVEDEHGNQTNDTVDFTLYKAYQGQIVITEIMADPTPVVGNPPNALPEREYLELYNNGGFAVNLENWKLGIGASAEIFPNYQLDSGAYVVISKDEGVHEFPNGTPLIGMDIGSTALINSGTTLSLTSSEGMPVHTVSYTDTWYDDENKSNGGWALEMVDINNICAGKENWKASVSPVGGTPGKLNSVAGFNPDTTRPVIERVALDADSIVSLHFSEKVNSFVLNPGSYRIDPHIGIDSVFFENMNQSIVSLQLTDVLKPEVLYHISMVNLPVDCSGNTLMPDTLIFGIPSVPVEGDILINEVLFNPYPEGADFVELVNHSEKFFDLSNVYLGNWNSETSSVENPEPVLSESYLWQPGEYLAVSTDPVSLKSFYTVKNSKTLIKAENMPSLPDAEGSVAVVTSNLATVCDYLEYTEKMHTPLLEDEDGVSVERVNPGISSQSKSNWQSAASAAGFATPGYENSMAYSPVINGAITIDPKVFSPNQDGYRDVVNINYSFRQAGNVVTLSIWNSNGQPVRELQQNTSVGQEGFFSWDGTDVHGQRLNSGIYIVVVEYFNTDGETGTFKETCVLSL